MPIYVQMSVLSTAYEMLQPGCLPNGVIMPHRSELVLGACGMAYPRWPSPPLGPRRRFDGGDCSLALYARRLARQLAR